MAEKYQVKLSVLLETLEYCSDVYSAIILQFYRLWGGPYNVKAKYL